MRRFLEWTGSHAAGVSSTSLVGRQDSSFGPNDHLSDRNQLSQEQLEAHHFLNDQQSFNPARDLEIQHLIKLLHEIKYYQASSSPLPSATGSQSQKEFAEKVYRTLPLFLNVFGPNPASVNPAGQMTSLVSENVFSRTSTDIHLIESSYCESNPSSRQNSPLPPNYLALDRFPELLPFAFTVARLFVSEVRQRASNKHAEDASQAILLYLSSHQSLKDANEQVEPPDVDTIDESAQGWNLLLTLNTLALTHNGNLIQLFCDASLPSTLVKCLYLLFDLPSTDRIPTSPHSDSTKDEISLDHSKTTDHSIISKPLIRIFTQLLVKLCSHQICIDELIKKDDLRLLMGIASSHCSFNNKPWRRVAFQALLAISKHMRDNFLYLQQNMCLQVYVDNMQRIDSLGLANIEEFVDMIKTLLEFLYNLDVNNRNNIKSIAPLMVQFKNSRIMELITDLLHRIDRVISQEDEDTEQSVEDNGETAQSIRNQPSVSSEPGVRLDDYRRYGKRLIHSLSFMAKINISPEAMSSISNLKPLATSRFEMLDQFRLPKPSASNSILNTGVLTLLKSEWSKLKDSHLIEAILDVTIALFNDDKFNYFIFESQQLLIYYLTSQNFILFPYKVKQKLFKFIEFIIIETHYIPCLELGTIGTIIKKSTSSNADVISGLRTFIACLRFDSKFCDIFREIGLLETVIETLVDTMQCDELHQNSSKLEVLYLLLETSQYLLAGPNNPNCTQFNESGAARHVFNCLTRPEFSYLFVPTHSSSSDDSNAANGPMSRTSTPPQSANFKNNQYSSEAYLRTVVPRPSFKQLQKVAFTIIRQLILSTAGDEHLANLLGLLARNLDDLRKIDGPPRNSSDCSSEDLKTNHNVDLIFLLSQEVNLKICILKSLMVVLKESHRSRTLFRKAGGFVYLISCINSLERSLPSPSSSEDEVYLQWRKINPRRLWRLLKSLLMTIIVAMRSEPANQRAFSDEMLDKFTNSIKQLGCFKASDSCSTLTNQTCKELEKKSDLIQFRTIFLSPQTRDYSTLPADNITASECCCQIFRFLFDMSLDMGDSTSELEEQFERGGTVYRLQQSKSAHETKSMSFDQGYLSSRDDQESTIFKRRSQMNTAPRRPPSLDLITKDNKRASILVFPSIVLSMVDLIPSSPSKELARFVSIVILSLFKHERNQQVLSGVGLISKLLNSDHWKEALSCSDHFLHDLAQTMFEKMTRQSISAKELRSFLRLGDPLRCKNLDAIEVRESCDETRQKLSEAGSGESSLTVLMARPRKDKIPYRRIETLVSMMEGDKFRFEPPFVEFDMVNYGSSSIFMPSIAPINSKTLPPHSCNFLNSTLDIHISEKNGILGGLGSTERPFPPSNGFTYSAWICIERFSSRSPDSNHNIKLLTVYRGSASTGKEYSCLRIQISALDRAILVSTQELPLFDTEKSDVSSDPDYNLRVWTPELLVEGKWHHIGVSLSKSSTKQSTACVYIDGSMVYHQKICYMSTLVGSTFSGPLGSAGGNNGSTSAAAYVNAFIGSLPQYRYQLRTHWKLGPCHLLEESLSANFMAVIYALGPSSIGNFQSQIRIGESGPMKTMQQYSHLERLNSQLSEANHQPLVQQQSVSGHGYQAIRNPSNTRLSTSSVSQSQSGSHHSSSSHNSVSEDRILMSIDARAISLMTLSRMRRVYTRFDCRQVSRVLGSASHDSSIPIMLLHNTGVHLNGPSRGVGAIVVGYNQVRSFVPNPTHQTLVCLGGSHLLIGLVAQAQSKESFYISMKALVCALKHNVKLQAQMDLINGYQTLSVIFWKKKHLLTANILKLTFSLITDCAKFHYRSEDSQYQDRMREVHQLGPLRDLVCECFDLWLQTDMIDSVLDFIHELIKSNHQEQSLNRDNAQSVMGSIRARNLKYLRDLDLLPRMLRLLPQYDSQQMIKPEDGLMKSSIEEKVQISALSFDTKAIYLIRQTVFELLNRTPRQSDILYFGQFLASLLPSKPEERDSRTVSLRNILLRSLLQMMTKNRQKEINDAVQEELVRILGFDWFMLFISSPSIDQETILLGLINLMIILSNDELYESFKTYPHGTKACNGGWLKEPVFPTMDGKFNIQLLGINVGVFFGLSGKRKSIRKDVIDSPNFFLLRHNLTNLIKYPRVYLIIFQTMMNRLNSFELNVIESLEAFDQMSLDTLCDCLVGDTHHKRRQTLSSIEFKCHELVVCLIYMLREIMWEHVNKTDSPDMSKLEVTEEQKLQMNNYPVDLTRFLMYLYNNNLEFQDYCKHSNELIDALCESIVMPPNQNPSLKSGDRAMTQHPASKEILELSRLIILDKMTESNQSGDVQQFDNQQLLAFERFLDSLSSCREAQGELVDMLLHQILLMIDSTARHNSIKTICSSENATQFQLLLTNSITIAQIVTDKIWSNELYHNSLARVLNIIDHQLCLAEQIFKFNEMLPKHNPPYAFIMQRVLNRTLLFALSRPMQHMSDKMLVLDLLKKIFDNRTIIILNHMHSPHSAEFFVCFTYSLLKIIEENSVGSNYNSSILDSSSQPSSLIERQFGNPCDKLDTPSSSALMLASMARKVWDAIYQSKKGILSEAFDVSLSLPAFTLDTSLDLLQLKPDIIECCEKTWLNLNETEQKPKRRLQQKLNEPATGNAASTAVNILSGRLTRVVNAASFVSRVVGATAGSMASNVNLVGEKLSQSSKGVRRENSIRNSPTTITGPNLAGQGQVQSTTSQTQTSQLVPNMSNLSTSTSTSSGAQTSIDQTELFKHHSLTKTHIMDASQAHISIIEDYIETQLSQKNHKLALHKYLCDEWLDTEFEVLLRERALFGPDCGSPLDKWCLDMTEGPRRMRKKMINNTRQFFEYYQYQPDHFNPSNKSLRYRPPMSYDSYQYFMKTMKLDSHLLDVDEPQEQELDELESKSTSRGAQKQDQPPSISIESATSLAAPGPSTGHESPVGCMQSSTDSLTSAGKLAASIATVGEPASPRHSEIDPDDGDSTSFVDFSPEIEAESNSARNSETIDSLSVLRLLEKNERISHMFRCSRVQGLDTHEGLLLFGREHFYLIDGFTLLKTREIKDIDSLPPDAHDPIIPNSAPNILAHSRKTCSKFSFDNIVEVHKRRYLLQPIALEVFSSDGRNTLIVFPRNIRNKVYSRLMTVSNHLTSNVHESLAGQKSNVSVEGGSGLLSNLIGDTSVTQRWVRGELSNFQYLMNLNTIAGRSYNDLMQYPIFPWILADYTSDSLDLSKASTFRDLSRPVGAQTSERLEQFKRRYAEWDDTETPPYHYGTFYSSAMIVASYMVRMEPFTQHFLRLQGGHFDLADRMFHSIHDSWLSASKHNMADIKELIPEFFYLPEFLKNENKFDLGIKQNGMKLNDVILPPWAKNDTREFIRMHRCALESDYVSAHLHEWIDLIFGYKQQGQAAVDAVNVFHHLFYEGNVDIYNTDIDPIKKNAVIGFINNFGQVPKQLFKKPHPARKVTLGSLSSSQASAMPALTPMLPVALAAANSTSASTNRILTSSPQSLRPSATTYKDLRMPVGQIVHIDKNLLVVEQNKLLIPSEYCRCIGWGYADRSLRLSLYDSEKPIFVWEGSDNMWPNDILCCTIPNSRTMITAGTEPLITVWKIEKMRSFSPVSHLYGHVEPVTCLTSSQAYSIVVSGSRDRTAIIWDLNRLTFVCQLGRLGPDKFVHHGPISAIAINDSTGDIATCALSWLYLWTINGELLAQIDSLNIAIQQSMCGSLGNPGPLHLLSVCFSQHHEWDADEVILTGASDGSVAFWSLRYYQSPMSDAELAEETKRLADLTNNPIHQRSEEEPVKQELSLADDETDCGTDKESVTSADQSTRTSSEPINITRSQRQRTDTMNSEWVRLSASSTSTTADTIPVLKATPSSIGDNDQQSMMSSSSPPLALSDKMNDSFIHTPLSSTPVKEAASATGHSRQLQTKSSAEDGKLSLPSMTSDPSAIKFSRSDTSLVESFVILGSDSGGAAHRTGSNQMTAATSKDRRPQSSIGSRPSLVSPQRARMRLLSAHNQIESRTCPKLLPNHCWRRELYLRHIISRREGKCVPGAVTSLAISKDHKTLFVGDSNGRISSWCTS